MKEIERRFLVHVDKLPPLPMHRPFQIITQGYLHDDNPLVRVRTINWSDGLKWARCTFKGRGLVERDEIEFPMPYEKAEQALELWAKTKIVKHRYIIDTPLSSRSDDGRVWELDQFQLDLEGLWIVEVELKYPDEPFDSPEWLGREVTNDSRYTNVRLAQDGIPDESKSSCAIPPEGWYCTREAGHDGPCAAWPTNKET